MKNLVLALVAVVSFLFVSDRAEAQQFRVNADCSFNQAQGRCEVYNSGQYPIFCQLHARGRTAGGFWANWTQNNVIPPGSGAYIFVNAGYGDFLVEVNGYANCRF